jgi:hypothetical protein
MSKITRKRIVYCPHCKEKHLVDFISRECFMSRKDENNKEYTQSYRTYSLKCPTTNKYIEDNDIHSKNELAHKSAFIKLERKVNKGG